MLYIIGLNGRKTWATNVVNYLYKLGFGIVWINQEVDIVSLFICELKKRQICQAKQDWNSELTTYIKLELMKETNSLL